MHEGGGRWVGNNKLVEKKKKNWAQGRELEGHQAGDTENGEGKWHR